MCVCVCHGDPEVSRVRFRAGCGEEVSAKRARNQRVSKGIRIAGCLYAGATHGPLGVAAKRADNENQEHKSIGDQGGRTGTDTRRNLN